MKIRDSGLMSTCDHKDLKVPFRDLILISFPQNLNQSLKGYSFTITKISTGTLSSRQLLDEPLLILPLYSTSRIYLKRSNLRNRNKTIIEYVSSLATMDLE